MKRALIVGIDFYTSLSNLNGCVNDACSVASVLERNFDGSLNFDVKKFIATNKENMIYKNDLEDSIIELFSGDGEVALFYFSGHGYTENNNGYIICSDTKIYGRNGIKMEDIMQWCNQ